MNYYKIIATEKILGVEPGQLFTLEHAPHDNIYRIHPVNGLETRVGTRWITSMKLNDILCGKLGDIMPIGFGRR